MTAPPPRRISRCPAYDGYMFWYDIGERPDITDDELVEITKIDYPSGAWGNVYRYLRQGRPVAEVRMYHGFEEDCDDDGTEIPMG